MAQQQHPESGSDKALAVLNVAFAERHASLAAYMLDAGPYVGEDDKLLLIRLGQVAGFDAAQAKRLASLIEDLGGVPQIRTIDPEITEYNYTAVPFLAKSLRAMLANQLTRYEALLPDTDSIPEARHAMERLCAGIRTQTALLEV